ncbi:MAG: SAM-dependent methyltransferase [Candidatus Thermoplasmatota archaeon]|jgi:23S rRNA (uridine2552-2'-O)-methyltransferase|nr:SAM-dependent methyltransferase [Candidatus Thermoplasmatota archaeon]
MSRPGDKFYKRARSQGYRSRAAYKLLEMQNKFEFIREEMDILEVGSAPGGWTDVIMEMNPALLVCVDLAGKNSMEQPVQVKGDILREETWEKIAAVTDKKGFDLILSDAMAHTTGQHHRDHALSMEICSSIMNHVPAFLKPGGTLVMKQFQGDMTDSFVQQNSRKFKYVYRTKPHASRDSSSEMYIIFSRFHL